MVKVSTIEPFCVLVHKLSRTEEAMSCLRPFTVFLRPSLLPGWPQMRALVDIPYWPCSPPLHNSHESTGFTINILNMATPHGSTSAHCIPAKQMGKVRSVY